MKFTKKKILIVLFSLFLVVLVGFFLWKNWPKNLSKTPDINHIYVASDFATSKLDQESLDSFITRLNKDYQWLRDNVEFDHYDIWVDIGNTKLGLKDYTGATEAWEYAITLNSVRPLAYANLAAYYRDFAKDYNQAVYYYDLAISKDNIGYFFDYKDYADLYTNGYLPNDAMKVESIMLDGVSKAGNVDKISFYQYLYDYWKDKDQAKVDKYKNFILSIDPKFKF